MKTAIGVETKDFVVIDLFGHNHIVKLKSSETLVAFSANDNRFNYIRDIERYLYNGLSLSIVKQHCYTGGITYTAE